VDESTIYRALSRWFILGRNKFAAKVRVEEDGIRYVMEISQNYHPYQLVFVDEPVDNAERLH